jgi:23S rRNA pseudouridine1911/1915/1917 synthase
MISRTPKVQAVHVVPADAPAERISKYLKGVFEALPSTNAISRALKAGEVLANGVAVSSAHRVAAGERIEVLVSEKSAPKPYSLKLQVLYEDEFLAVVFKPAGLEVFGKKFKTLQNAILHNLKPQEKCAGHLDYPRPVHRLDYATSGPVIVAKTHLAICELGRQFTEREVFKRYRAVVMGRAPAKGLVQEPLSGQEACTRFELVEEVPSLKSGHLSLLDVFPETGRMHQIRRHLQHLGLPILGDTKYGPPAEKNLKGKSLFLAAVELAFCHPHFDQKEKPLHIEVPMPEKFRAQLDREQRRYEKFTKKR